MVEQSLEEAINRITRAYRVKFDREPTAEEEISIKLAAPRIIEGESFHWSEKGGFVRLNFASEGQQSEEDVQASDLLALESEIVEQSPNADSTRGPTAKEMQYCRYRSVGDTQATAYMKAGYKAGSERSASACACTLEKRPAIRAYLNKLKESSYLANVLTLAEKRSSLADVWRTPIGEIDANHPLAQSAKYDRETGVLTEIKMPDKLKALELDAKLAGELKEQTQVSVGFNFAMLGERMEDIVELDSPPATQQALP